MKKLIALILSILVFSGCGYTPKPRGKVIASKSYSFEPRKKLMPCICMYEYYSDYNLHLFEDSCKKYQIGDTIK